MKRLFAIISIFLFFGLTACGTIDYDGSSTTSNTEMQISKPNQEVMLVLIRRNLSEGNHSSASVIDINGGYHSLSESFSFAANNWQQMLINATKTEAKRSIDHQHLSYIYQFINEFDIYGVYDVKTYDYTVWDYGTRDLYVIYTNEDGDIRNKLLCRYGDTTQCINSKDVQEFVNWMIDNQYFSVVGNFRY